MIHLLRSKTARNSYLNLIGLAVPLVIGVALVPITMHGLGIARYGLLSLALTVLEYSTFFSLGLGPATTKYVAEAIATNDEGKSDVIILSMLGHTCLGAIGGFVIVLAAPFLAEHVFVLPLALRHEATAVFRLIGLMVPVTLLLLSMFGALEGASKFGLVNGLRIPISTLSFIVPAVAVTRGVALPTILLILVALRLAICVLLAPVVSTSISGFQWRWPQSLSRLRPMLAFGGWLSVSNVLSPTLVYADRFILSALKGVAAVGFYSAPFDAAMRLQMIPGSLSRAMFPTASALSGTSNHENLRALFRRAAMTSVLLVSVPVLILMLFAPLLLKWWLGPEVAVAAGTATRILALGLLFNAGAHVATTCISAIGRPDVGAKLHAFELLLHLPLAWWLVSHYGITGAAWAWTIRVILDAFLLFLASQRLLNAPRAAAFAEPNPAVSFL